jgi:hypothetical protein
MIGVSALKTVLAAAAFAVSPVYATVAHSEPNCTCRYKGQSFALESCICLSTSAGPRLACCGMVLNNTSWKFTDRLCPVAERTMPNQSFAAWRDKTQSSVKTLRR